MHVFTWSTGLRVICVDPPPRSKVPNKFELSLVRLPMINNIIYTSESLWKISLVENIQSIHNSLWTWHDKCNIYCRYYIYHVKFNICLVTKGFSPGSPVFLPPQKSTLLNSNLIWKQWMKSHFVEMPLQSLIHFFLIFFFILTSTSFLFLLGTWLYNTIIVSVVQWRSYLPYKQKAIHEFNPSEAKPFSFLPHILSYTSYSF